MKTREGQGLGEGGQYGDICNTVNNKEREREMKQCNA